MRRAVRNICLLSFSTMLCIVAGISAKSQDNPVPIIFTSFKADIFSNNSVRLNWELSGNTADSMYFTIERSVDGVIFQPLHKTIIRPEAGSGVYRYTDFFALNDSAFYRVAGLNETGAASFSPIHKIQFPRKPKAEIIIMPNPVFNNASLIINDEGMGEILCTLYDLTGKNIRSYQLRKNTVYMQHILDMYSVPRGEYILNIRSAFVNETKRILKQ